MRYIFVFRVMMNADSSVPNGTKYYSDLESIDKEDGMLVSIHPVRFIGCTYDDFLYPEVIQYRNGKFHHYEIGYGYSWLSLVNDNTQTISISASDFIMYKNMAFRSDADLIDYLEKYEGLAYHRSDSDSASDSSSDSESELTLKRTYANASYDIFRSDNHRGIKKQIVDNDIKTMLDDDLIEYHRQADCYCYCHYD